MKKQDCSIELSREELQEVLNYDPETGLFTWKITRQRSPKGQIAGSETDKGYIRIEIYGKSYAAHKLAWFYIYGEWPNLLDHKNQIKGDNRISNLRLATVQQNNRNRDAQINNMLGVKGVGIHNRKYRARIRVNGTLIHLGSYRTIEEAVNARRNAEKIYFGEFAPEG